MIKTLLITDTTEVRVSLRSVLSSLHSGFEIIEKDLNDEKIIIAPKQKTELILIVSERNIEKAAKAISSLKKVNSLKSVPLICIAEQLPMLKKKLKTIGSKADAYICLPFEYEELEYHINALVNNTNKLDNRQEKASGENDAELITELKKETNSTVYTSESQKIAMLNLLEDLKNEIAERSQAQNLLNSREEQLRTLINAMPDIVCFKDANGRWLEANEFDLALFGLTGVDYRGQTDLELAKYSPFYSEAFALCEKTDEITWKKREPTRCDEIIPRPDNTPLIFDVIKIPSYNADGSRKGLVIVGRDITERRKAESNLQTSENQLRTLINAMPDFVCFKNSSGQWMVANDFALNLFSLKDVDYVGKKDSELGIYTPFHQAALDYCGSSDELAWELRVPMRCDESISMPDGSTLIFDTIKIPEFDADGNRKGMVVVGRDITERKISEQELQKLSQVVMQSPDSIVVTNYDGIIEYVNPAACRITGYTEEELIGNNPSLLASGEIPKEKYRELWNTIKAGKEWNGEFHNRKKNGELYWESASISPLRNHKGEISHFLGIKEDITERKYNESVQQVLFNISKLVIQTNDVKSLLRNIRLELSILMDTRNFFVAFYDEENDLLSAQYSTDEHDEYTTWPAQKSLTGYVIRHNKPMLLRSADFQELLKTGEVELVGTDSAVWLGVPLTVDGKPYGAFVVQNYTNANAYNENDLRMLEFIASQVSLSIQREKSILDLKQALVDAEAGNRLKTAFINNISHEIRTPLNGILGFSEMIISSDSSAEDNELFFSVIKKSSKRLLNTVNSYMDISLLVSGTMELSRRPANIHKLLDEVYNDFSDTCAAKNLTFNLKKPELKEPLVLNTDVEKLRKTLTHLLDNAVKFTMKGSISFGYVINGSEFEFYITDTGSGIESNVLNVIFDPFMQADISPTRGYEGSGLGLTIARGLVKLMGGTIRVDTMRGKGTTIFFSLPVSSNPVFTPEHHSDIHPQEQNLKPLILVAEDDDSNYKYIEIVLKYAAFEVIRAENGLETVEICRSNPNVRLILMDIKMPLMDGFEATRQIRTFMPRLPVIALTAHVTAEDENAAIAAGCTEYVTKPVSKDKLLEIVANSLISNN